MARCQARSRHKSRHNDSSAFFALVNPISRRCLLLTILAFVLAGNVIAQDNDLELALRIERERAEIIERASQATISVFDTAGKGGGSGVLISRDGFAVTNYHVVKPCGPYMHCSLPDGDLYDAVLVGLDPTGDVALIKLMGRDDFPAARFGNSDQVQVGEYCFAIGNPFLLATDFQPTVTWGIVSGVHRYQYPAGTLLEYADCIQTDASINPGNSGGPLFNSKGELIGINGRGSFEKRGRVNVGVGYSISINQVQLFLNHLMSGRIVDHASLGATVSTNARGEIRVDNILQTSDAWRRGLRYDDEIVSFGGRQIHTVNQFKNVLGIYPKGWRVPLIYKRDDRENEIVVRLDGVHSAEELNDIVQGPFKPGEIPAIEKLDPEKQSPAPDEVKDLIEMKRGYANFHFNRLHANTIWTGAMASGDTTRLPKRWTISATCNEMPVKWVFRSNGAGMQWEDRTFVLESDVDLGQQLHPAETGGLLPAMAMWQRLLSLGRQAYGDVYYFGDLPNGEALARRDVLVGNYDVGESFFFFDRTTRELRGLEFWTERSRDPVEIQFADFRVVDGVSLPHRISVQYGDDAVWIIEVDGYEFDVENEER